MEDFNTPAERVIEQILTGEHDKQLRQIAEACETRGRYLDPWKPIGDLVRCYDHMNIATSNHISLAQQAALGIELVGKIKRIAQEYEDDPTVTKLAETLRNDVTRRLLHIDVPLP